jgi:hypothetical protein
MNVERRRRHLQVLGDDVNRLRHGQLPLVDAANTLPSTIRPPRRPFGQHFRHTQAPFGGMVWWTAFDCDRLAES